jgi:2-keto-4-pentenoate hydratase
LPSHNRCVRALKRPPDQVRTPLSVTDASSSFDQIAAARVLHAIASGTFVGEHEELPAELADYANASEQDGLALQLAVIDLWAHDGELVGGWKISSVTPGEPATVQPFGYILASRIIGPQATIDGASIPGGALEPEIAVTFGRRLTGRVSTEEARSAVSSLSGAFEICSFRLPKSAPPAVRIADASSNWGLMLGPAHHPDIDLATVGVEMWRDGESIGSSGTNLDVLVSAYESVACAAQELGERGLAFEPGQHAILGSMLPAVRIGDASAFRANFDKFGSISLRTG